MWKLLIHSRTGPEDFYEHCISSPDIDSSRGEAENLEQAGFGYAKNTKQRGLPKFRELVSAQDGDVPLLTIGKITPAEIVGLTADRSGYLNKIMPSGWRSIS